MVGFSDRLVVPADVLVRDLSGEIVLLNLQNERYFGLDAIGSRIWASITETGSMEAAYPVLLAEYEVDETQLRHDLQVLVEELVASGLLVVM